LVCESWEGIERVERFSIEMLIAFLNIPKLFIKGSYSTQTETRLLSGMKRLGIDVMK
jgi:hypothetical protein